MRQATKTAGIATLVVVGMLAAKAWADVNLVQNGGFEDLTGTSATPNQFIGYGVSELADWTYNPEPTPNAAVYTFAGANGTGAQQGPFGGFYPLYGPGNGYANGFVASPAGGNFLAVDGEAGYSPPTATISQTISGLTPGDSYVLSFLWAGNEFNDSSSSPYNGNLTSDWQVSLGTQTFTTPDVTYAAHGFTGWMTESFTYTATSTSEVLSFLAQGTPDGLPPVALLDGVSLTVPEPASWTVMLVAIAGLAAAARTHRRSRATAG